MWLVWKSDVSVAFVLQFFQYREGRFLKEWNLSQEGFKPAYQNIHIVLPNLNKTSNHGNNMSLSIEIAYYIFGKD